jgi:hypothetical protein
LTASEDIYHKSRVYRCPHISAERVPTFRVKEIPEFPEVVVDQKFGGSEVEPGIELMDDGLITDDAEYTYQCGNRTDEEKDGDAYGWFPLGHC